MMSTRKRTRNVGGFEFRSKKEMTQPPSPPQQVEQPAVEPPVTRSQRKSRRTSSIASTESVGATGTPAKSTQKSSSPPKSSTTSNSSRTRKSPVKPTPKKSTSKPKYLTSGAPTYPETHHDDDIVMPGVTTPDARLTQLLHNLLDSECDQLAEVFNEGFSYIHEAAVDVSNIFTTKLQSFLVDRLRQRRLEAGKTKHLLPNPENRELSIRATALRKLVQDYRAEMERWKSVQADFSDKDPVSLEEFLQSNDKDPKQLDDTLWQKFNSLQEFMSSMGDSMDTLQLQTDSLKRLLRYANNIVEDSQEITSDVTQTVRSKAFTKYENVDQPSRLLRKLAAKTPETKHNKTVTQKSTINDPSTMSSTVSSSSLSNEIQQQSRTAHTSSSNSTTTPSSAQPSVTTASSASSVKSVSKSTPASSKQSTTGSVDILNRALKRAAQL